MPFTVLQCVNKDIIIITTTAFIDTTTCLSNKVNFNWDKATDKDLLDYKYFTRRYCNDIHVVDVVKCDDVNC